MFTKKSDKGFLTPMEGARIKTLAFGEKTSLCEFRMTRGAALPSHTHPHEQTGYLVSGRLNLVVGDETFEAEPGDSWCIPGDTPHGAEVLDDAVVVEVFCPVREDYLS